MANNDTVKLAVATYQCNGERGQALNCADNLRVLFTQSLYGSIECTDDSANCVLNGESSRKVMRVQGSGGQTLTLRALNFQNGLGDLGGGAYIRNDAIVEILLCVFSNCSASSGGALHIIGSGPSINVYGTTFSGNTATSGNGNDINHISGTITIYNTCPSPYSSNTPTQGKTRLIRRTIESSIEPFNTSKLTYISQIPIFPPSFPAAVLDTYGTVSGTTYSYPNCIACGLGYSGVVSSCTADPCVATSNSTDSGFDGNFFCINGGTAGGTTGACTCTSCNTDYVGPNCHNTAHNVADSDTLYSAASDSGWTQGDTYKLAGATTYQGNTIQLNGKYGSIECTNDTADCILDGEESRRLIYVAGTVGRQTLTLRAITFLNGQSNWGGGAYILSGTIIIELCIFRNCKATSNDSDNGGGAIYLHIIPTTMNIYGTTFSGNIATSGNGNDIYNYLGTITIHDTCPSPYSFNTPTQGKMATRRRISSSVLPSISPKFYPLSHSLLQKALF